MQGEMGGVRGGRGSGEGEGVPMVLSIPWMGQVEG